MPDDRESLAKSIQARVNAIDADDEPDEARHIGDRRSGHLQRDPIRVRQGHTLEIIAQPAAPIDAERLKRILRRAD